MEGNVVFTHMCTHTEISKGQGFPKFSEDWYLKLYLKVQNFQLLNWGLAISSRFGAVNTILSRHI